MYPNFFDHEYVLTNIITLRFNNPKIGDVVVFKSPSEPDKDFIKRVIGTPGDTVYIKKGEVYVNDKKLDQSKFLDSSITTNPGPFLSEDKKVKVPNGSYLVMGDNRSESSDSREWGLVPVDSIIGKSFFTYWPINKMGSVKNPYN
jgi:signal peptidase I